MKARKAFELLAVVVIGLGGPASGRAQEPQEHDPEDRPKPRVTRPPRRKPELIAPGRGDRRPRVTTRPRRPAGQRGRPSRRTRERPLVELEIACGDQAWGSIVLELHPERTPITVRNFLRYVDEGFYDGTIFHRVLPDFVVQGGGYASLDEKKTEGLHAPIANEARHARLKNTRGTIAMARKREPNTAVAQFFINLADNKQLDYPRAGRNGYCVFGRVIEGMHVVDRIKSAPTRVSPEAQRRFERYQAEGQQVERAEKSQPLMPPMIKQARRLERAEFEQRERRGPLVTRPAGSPEDQPPESDEEEEIGEALEEDPEADDREPLEGPDG